MQDGQQFYQYQQITQKGGRDNGDPNRVQITSIFPAIDIHYIYPGMSKIIKQLTRAERSVILIIIPPTHRRGYTVLSLSVLPSVCPSVRPKIFFVAFFSATIDGRNLIFGHKLHIGTPYRGKRFWTRHIPTACLPTWLVFIHNEHICGGIISEH